MKRTEPDELLREILTGEEVAGFRRASLERGLKALKARRRHRALGRVCAGASLALALAAVLLWPSLQGYWSRRAPTAGAPEVVKASAPPDANTVRFISDDELMALFPNQSVALIGKPGHQEFVFLDGGNETSRYQ